jgi:hypothetical protein
MESAMAKSNAKPLRGAASELFEGAIEVLGVAPRRGGERARSRAEAVVGLHPGALCSRELAAHSLR